MHFSSLDRRKRFLLSFFFSAAMFAVSVEPQASEMAAEKLDSARFCKVNVIEVAAERDAQGNCPAPAVVNEGGACVTKTQAHNAFNYIAGEDDSIDFGLSYWFANGAHCGIIGHAEMTKNGWRYEHNMDSDDPLKRCGLRITIENDLILFDADKNAGCRYECGAQGNLYATFIPVDSFERSGLTAQDLEPEVFYNTPCQKP